jgi:predicted RNase H-like HicB family nuclease
MTLNVALERTETGSWVAQIIELPEVRALGEDRLDAVRRVQARVLRYMARQLESQTSAPAAPKAEMKLAFSIL